MKIHHLAFGVALPLLLGVAVLVWGCSRAEPVPADADPFTGLEDIITLPGHGPQVRREANAVADDPVANAFIDRFVRVALAGNYTQYRLMTSIYSDPASREDFRRAWQAVEAIEVAKVAKRDLPPRSGSKPDPDDAPKTGYEVTLRVTLHSDVPLVAGQRERIVRLLVAREGPQGAYRARPLGSSPFVPEEPASGK